MSDWQVGDLALCVSRINPRPVVGRRQRGDDPRVGQVLTVARIGRDDTWGLWLGFEEYRPHRYRSFRFRKVTPPAADEFDRETIELMNRAPEKEPANA